jgi:hypothetical protein
VFGDGERSAGLSHPFDVFGKMTLSKIFGKSEQNRVFLPAFEGMLKRFRLIAFAALLPRTAPDAFAFPWRPVSAFIGGAG